MSRKPDLLELDIPDSVFQDQEPKGVEFVHFWVCDGNDHVALNIGSFQPPEDEPRQWGYIMADIARHAVRGMEQDDPSRGTSAEIFAEIERGFRERLEKDLDFSGQLRGNKQ
jgi:hypothetical protein